ncbi:MAG: hypothetical protein KTR31_38775 [Myxococcales bacterium]|nr:hypothetical protein [Myxococcales bacterium]
MHAMIPLTLALLACTEAPTAVGPRPLYQPDGVGFWSSPWPSDRRLDDDGTLAMTAFPNPFAADLLADYIELAEAHVGFGTNSPVYLGFDGPLDPLTLPDPEQSLLDPESSLLLVDVDPQSPYWGERVPVLWQQNAFVGSVYMPEHQLAVAPLYGFPLRPRTKYALIVTTRAATRHEGWAGTLQPGHPDHDADLVRALFSLDLHPDDLAIATTFTTQDPVEEMAKLAAFAQRRVAPADLGARTLEHLSDQDTYTAWRTRYMTPVFTHGEPPYTLEGGGLRFDEQGEPVLSGFDEMRLAVCTPLTEAPPEGWAVVIYQHGTGGAYRGFCDSSRNLEVMNRLGEVGLIGLGIDQPLHGSRPGGDRAGSLDHFNIVNPESGITNFRQGAVDAIYLARSLAAKPHTFRAPDGRSFTTDPSRVLFMGHSQGGLTGGLAAPFVGNDVQAMVLSGAGSVLAITIVERKDPLDFALLVRQLIDLADGEPLTPLHPVVGLMQTLVEPTDPANYAPYWFSQPGTWPGHAPVPVLHTSGTEDAATPYRTAIAQAAAARLPLVGVPATSTLAVQLRTGEAAELPVFGNVTAFDGSTLTAGFHQWFGGSHFVVFENRQASDLYVEYLRTTAAGRPRLGER